MFAFLFWTVIAVAALTVELATGTLYLLVLGVAAAVTAGYAASAPNAWGEMLLVFAVVSGAGVVYLRKRKQTPAPTVLTDEGAEVEVVSDLGAGQFRVRYRGSEWDAFVPESESTSPAQAPKTLRIERIEGIRLICAYL